ncbi:hypothetical protein M4I32_03665 [Microbacterium sp. LRZ72]|uniref:baeRF11 domain-containing protein n=1 Tax=Microbacterium sp. LRZ72 TaxID=2942481 RepID=UPI0029B7630C|nr:hypothetical protein [Microbacterium sp. LRZ72]MDX2375894.1 hypothetical protein [Microbacterium sp. LRZ72]
MLPADLPDTAGLLDLTDARSEASVTIVATSSPVPAEHGRVRIGLRNLIDDAERQLAEGDVPGASQRAVIDPLRELLDENDPFWTHQSASLIIFASPERIETFRLANAVEDHASVGDRFDTGPLLRAITFPHRAFVLQLSKGEVRLSELGPDHRLIERPLALPDDHHTILERAENHGQADMPRPQGTTGDRLERERYCRVVQDELVKVVPKSIPVILAATTDLDPAYRAVNTHPLLLEKGIDAHPDSLTERDIDGAARGILDEHYAAELSDWRERFGSLRSEGLATSRIAEVAVAASAAGIDELLFNMDDTAEGTIDDYGRIEHADEPGPDTYVLVDEIAARVLRSGGRARAVRNKDLLDGSPVAATLRFPVPENAN